MFKLILKTSETEDPILLNDILDEIEDLRHKYRCDAAYSVSYGVNDSFVDVSLVREVQNLSQKYVEMIEKFKVT